jgi:beta-glucosidase
VNYYTVNAVRALEGPVPLEVVPPAGYPRTGFDWAVAPEGLTEVLVRLHREHGAALPPLYVTENGCAYPDGPGDPATGSVPDDDDRIAYLAAHVDAVREAVAQGVDVRGFHAWTLMDNFEWAAGYTQRFGLVHVDFATLERTPRASFAWYRDLALSART